jgi:hypothetical protein
MKNIFLIITLLSSGIILAQESVNTSGSNASGTGGAVSYTVGQVAYTNSSGSNGSVSAGVQQSYTITATTGVDENNFNLDVSVYPNPTTDLLVLSINELKEEYRYQVLDMAGKRLTNGQLRNNQTQLDFSSYAAGSYYVNIITNQNKQIKTFQVIKNK